MVALLERSDETLGDPLSCELRRSIVIALEGDVYEAPIRFSESRYEGRRLVNGASQRLFDQHRDTGAGKRQHVGRVMLRARCNHGSVQSTNGHVLRILEETQP